MFLFASSWIPSTGTVSWLDGLNIFFLLIWQVTFFVHSVKWIDVSFPLRVKNWLGIFSSNSLGHERGEVPDRSTRWAPGPCRLQGLRRSISEDTTLGMVSLLCEVCLIYCVRSNSRVSRGLSGKESASQCRRHGFNPGVGKILWRRKQQLTAVFLPEKSHGQRSLQDTVHRVTESDTTEQLSMHRGIQLWVVLPWVAILLVPPWHFHKNG